MIKEYEQELAELKERMLKAEEFAKKLPIFRNKIIADKMVADCDWQSFGDYYKTLFVHNGINRGLYASDTRYIINYDVPKYKLFLFCIYINSVSLFDSFEEYGLSDVANEVPIFFYDDINSTFYAEDHQIKDLLDALCKWEKRAINENKIKQLNAKILKFNDQLDSLKKEFRVKNE